MSWFLESWAVPDGCAFAAHRNYMLRGDGSREYLDPPDEVIYVAPPHFTPTPVGYATALAGARGRFQEKFVDQRGTEVPFETLEQLIELVRRAYLASGAGGAPPSDNAPKPDEPRPTLDEQEDQHWVEAVRRLKTGQTRDERKSTAAYLSSIWSPSASRSLVDFCGAVIEAYAREAALTSSRLDLERDLRDFTLLSVEMNEWANWHLGAQFLDDLFYRHWVHLGIADPGPPHWWWRATSTDDLSRALASGLLNRLPSPISWPPFQNLRRLGDHLAAATADRNYLASVTGFSQLLPLLTCSLALAAAESYRFRSGGFFRDASRVRSRAFRWLANEVPDSSLDALPMARFAVEQVLSKATSPNGRSTL
jgi:hypothetical protein